MHSSKDIVLAVDYHAENTEVRWLNCHSGEERCLNILSTRIGILRWWRRRWRRRRRLGAK